MSFIFPLGDKLADVGAQETSTVVVDTVAKFSKGGKNAGIHMPTFKSDATQVTSKGMGLKKAFIGKQNTFTVNATDAGKISENNKSYIVRTTNYYFFFVSLSFKAIIYYM